MEKKKVIQVVICVAAVFACGIAYLVLGAKKGSPAAFSYELASEEKNGDTGENDKISSSTDLDSASGSAAASENDSVYVYVCGAVKNPGVYTFYYEPRAIEAVEAAGGFTKKADGAAVNLAKVLSDGEQFFVPKKGESSSGTTGSEGSSSAGGAADDRININTADSTELMKLSGIGESKAQAIISYREEHGAFSKPEDIKNIPGIKDGTYNKIKDRITV